MRLSRRYMWFGALIGLLAPTGLVLFEFTTRRNPDLYCLSVVLAVGGTIAFGLLGRMIGVRDEALQELSETDTLTALSNRRSFDRRLDLELSRTKRYGVKSALVMIDLDLFKVLNDRFGHRAGDEVLRRVASILDTEKRAGDLVVRYGGEEFAAILSDTTIGEAINWAERARQRIAACHIAWAGANLAVTASFGIAGAASWAVTKEQLVESADQMLYEAKHRGRNVVVAAADSGEDPRTRSDAPAGASRRRMRTPMVA
jgi:diguanylate cyclase (GGDEF)-like protein